MEVKTGFKRTDLGALPEEWQVMKLGELATIKDGTHQTPKYVAIGVPFYSVEHVTSGNFHETKFVSKEEHQFLTRYFKIEKNDILMTRIGSIGECKLVDWDVRASFYVSLALLKIKNASSAYIVQYSNSVQFKKEIDINSLQWAIPKKINLGAIANVRIAIPPLPEQDAIATTLSEMDALISGLDQLIAKKRDLKQAAMQQLLTGQRRLPGFSGAWEAKRLGDYVTFLRNGVNSRAELRPEGQVKYLHYGDIHACADSFLTPHSLPSLPDTKAARLDRLRDGDLIFADASEDMAGVCKSVELRDTRDIEVVSGLHTIAARFDKTIFADGFKGFLQYCPVFATHLRRHAAGTKVLATNRAHIASVEMRLPNIAEQVAIAEVLRDMNAELTALEARRVKAIALKQGMMQELLTGRIRLV